MRRIQYIHERPDWPAFRWDAAALASRLAAARHRQGRLLGRMEALGFQVRTETTLHALTEDALKTSEIEGETLDREQVRSSLVRRLGMDRETAGRIKNRADAIAAVVIDAARDFDQPLTADRLFMWHKSLFPTGGAGRHPITVGAWRTAPVQVSSERHGEEIVHFVAPSADRVAGEMERFLAWFEDAADRTDLVLKAAVAHLWFVTIHPFHDGNGRIGRSIADMALARSEGAGQRFYSMSARLRIERNAYYETLEAMQKDDLDITSRLAWFLTVFEKAISDAEATLAETLRARNFWERLSGVSINERQRMMLGRLLNGFEGKLTSSKWSIIAKCSQDTALRDISALVDRGALAQDPSGGRSTSYSLIV